MLSRIARLILISATLSSCSYAYDVAAVVRDGLLVFIVDHTSHQRPPCLRQVEVTAERPTKAQAETGDDASRISYGTFWFESVSYNDDCANRFPLPYGVTLKGEHQQDRGSVKAKPLSREVVYEVNTTTDATGYGSGRFIIHDDGRIENLRFRIDPADANELSRQPSAGLPRHRGGSEAQ